MDELPAILVGKYVSIISFYLISLNPMVTLISVYHNIAPHTKFGILESLFKRPLMYLFDKSV